MAIADEKAKDEKQPDVAPASPLYGSCPLPIFEHKQIVLGHGSGGKLTADLIDKVFLPAFRNPVLDKLDDQAVVTIDGARVAFTTDSFVVSPIFFPGGDIGRLAVHGTVNDLAMSGARPLYLSAAFILEEGLPADDLKRVVESMRAAAEEARGCLAKVRAATSEQEWAWEEVRRSETRLRTAARHSPADHSGAKHSW